MNSEEIIEMARQAGFDVKEWGDETLVRTVHSKGYFVVINQKLEAFAKLVAEREREALTPRCWTQEMNDAWNKSLPDLVLAFDELIRARKQA